MRKGRLLKGKLLTIILGALMILSISGGASGWDVGAPPGSSGDISYNDSGEWSSSTPLTTDGTDVTASGDLIVGGKTGIGVDVPLTKLHLEDDGAILAKGTFGSGWTEPNIGAGTRMMWYPRKSAFRMGYVDGTQWDNDNIGNYSFAIGSNNIAEGTNSFLGTGLSNSIFMTSTGVITYGTILNGNSSFIENDGAGDITYGLISSGYHNYIGDEGEGSVTYNMIGNGYYNNIWNDAVGNITYGSISNGYYNYLWNQGSGDITYCSIGNGYNGIENENSGNNDYGLISNGLNNYIINESSGSINYGLIGNGSDSWIWNKNEGNVTYSSIINGGENYIYNGIEGSGNITYGSISNGYYNYLWNQGSGDVTHSSIGNGDENYIWNDEEGISITYGSIGNGSDNYLWNQGSGNITYSSIGNGSDNYLWTQGSGDITYSSIGNGSDNYISNESSGSINLGSVVNGDENYIWNIGSGALNYAFLGSGQGNIIKLSEASDVDSPVIAGGSDNFVEGSYSSILGGHNNIVLGLSSAVTIGRYNNADGDYSWAGGSFMQLSSDADRTFIWGHSDSPISVATPDAFIIYSGDVGIATTAPQSLLDVQGPAGTGTDTPGKLTLATKETTIVAGDELGRINFNAPLEADGTDAILPGASIWAVAEDTFAADNNKTSLVFATGSSEAATEKMTLDSSGNLTVTGTIQGNVIFNTYSSDQTLTEAVHNGSVVQMTVAGEVTFWDATASTVGNFVTLWARDAEKIEGVPASGDHFVLFDGSALTADYEIDLVATAGNKVTFLCTAADTWAVYSESDTSTDGGVAD